MNLRVAERRLTVGVTVGVLAFVTIVVVEHLADSSLDPVTHEISEYVRGPLGWLMTVGFIVWALSLIAAALAMSARTRGRQTAIALLIAAGGLLLTACFATQTSAGRLPPAASLTVTGRLHDIGSGLATVALLGAALLSLRSRIAHGLRRVTLALLTLALLGDVTLLLMGPSVAGIRQRLLVAAACGWQLTLAWFLSRGSPSSQAPDRPLRSERRIG
jgi:hypothetical protein